MWALPGGVVRAGESECIDGRVVIKSSCVIRIFVQKLLDQPNGKLPEEYSHLEQKINNFFTYTDDNIVFRGVADDRKVFKCLKFQLGTFFMSNNQNKNSEKSQHR